VRAIALASTPFELRQRSAFDAGSLKRPKRSNCAPRAGVDTASVAVQWQDRTSRRNTARPVSDSTRSVGGGNERQPRPLRIAKSLSKTANETGPGFRGFPQGPTRDMARDPISQNPAKKRENGPRADRSTANEKQRKESSAYISSLDRETSRSWRSSSTVWPALDRTKWTTRTQNRRQPQAVA
jgi:hypothetical protein